MQADTIPPEIWEQYGLDNYADNGWLYARVDKGMYDLPQAGKVASDHLIPCLLEAGYEETRQTPGLFKHRRNGTLFVPVVDNFLIQYCT